MKPVLLQPAYVLHRRPYRETSFLIELLSQDYGRLTLIAKGVRKAKSRWAGILQPFVPLSVSWQGRAEIMTLTQAEVNGDSRHLVGEGLYAGFYLNELLMALLQKWDPHPDLFLIYDQTLCGLREAPLQLHYLRAFELRLLQEIGYGLLPKTTNSLHNTFASDQYYHFTPERGFTILAQGVDPSGQSAVFSGKSLRAIANEDWHEDDILQDAKRLVRFVLTPLLGTRQLYSRQLFMQPIERNKNNDN